MDPIEKEKPTNSVPLSEPTLNGLATRSSYVSDASLHEATKGAPMPSVNTRSKNPLKRLSKKQRIIILLVLLLIAGAAGYFIFIKKDSQTQNTVSQQTAPEKPQVPTSPLTGRQVASAEIASRPVTGVMIENSPDSRPQSGLYQADVVYEAIAEGGVTRFLAAYQESTPDKIGPIRSTRPYYVDFIAGLDGSLAHVGGSPEALQDIKTLGIKDLDEFFNPKAYTRIPSRAAPHNVYSDFSRFDALNKEKGYTTSKFTPLERKEDVAQTPTAANISFTMSGPTYNPQFSYDATTNSYLRSQAGAPHNDEQTGKQINPKVVIALITNKAYDPDGYHTAYTTTGSGKALIFQDGIVSEGVWNKPDRKASLQISDSNNLPMKLNVGQTWITAVGTADDVRYSL